MRYLLPRLLAILGLITACQSQTTSPSPSAPSDTNDTATPTTIQQLAPENLISVLTNRYNVTRTGANLEEVILNQSNVNADQFGKLFSRDVVGHIYAQPLYVPNVEIPDKGTHNVVYVATMHNMVYAYDADDPALNDPLWELNLGTPFTQNVYVDVSGGEHGVLSTPVIDPSTQTMYLVSRTWEDEQAFFKLHAVDIRTGESRPNSPRIIDLTMPGTGINNVNGMVYLDPYFQLQRTALLLHQGNIYFGFSAQNDNDWWFGWMPAYDAETLELTGLFNASPDGFFGGIWMGGSGIATDGTHLFLATGNGVFDADTGGRGYANSVLKLLHEGDEISVIDWFTPSNWEALDVIDADMGSTGMVLIEEMGLGIVGAKDSNLYVLDKNNMGHFNPEANSNLQTFSVGDGRMYVTPVYWGNGPDGKPTIYAWTEYDVPKAFTFDEETQNLIEEPSSTTPLRATGMPVGSLSLSANGTDSETGILWALYAPRAANDDDTGILVAFDATNLNRILWSSDIEEERDDVGLLAKFSPATVANGKVYVASFSNRLNVYGLINNTTP
jgi:hypothetical protein